jgi:hypothetical protein
MQVGFARVIWAEYIAAYSITERPSRQSVFLFGRRMVAQRRKGANYCRVSRAFFAPLRLCGRKLFLNLRIE